MEKGLGMWVMSKMVMFIFLFSLITVLGMYYAIYQDKVISDTGKKVTQSIAEQITDVVAYRRTSRAIWLAPSLSVRDVQKGYTLKVTYASQSGDVGRLAILLAWNDQEDPDSFSSASAVDFAIDTSSSNTDAVDYLCFYNVTSVSGGLNIKEIDRNAYDGLVVRPSAPMNYRHDYLLVYKTLVSEGGELKSKICVAAKSYDVGLKEAIDKLRNECDAGCTESV